MRIGLSFCSILWLATGLCAQNRGGGGRPTAPINRGAPARGGIAAPGRASTPVFRTRGPSAYPLIVGGYYAPDYYPTPYITQPYVYDEPAASPLVQPDNSAAMPPQQPVTPVIVNYNFNYAASPPANPDAADQRQAPAEDTPANMPSHYLIAFKDHTIYAATAYWVDGDTLHYFTAGNVHNQASLALVDREFTVRLNKEAGVRVNLPAPARQDR